MTSDNALEKVAAELPKDLVDALRSHGLHKVAAALTGTSMDEHAVYAKIGEALLLRKNDRRTVAQGLRSLAALEE